MKAKDIGYYAYHNLRQRKLRSWLTILGIVIGVASIITLISLANGVDAQISSRLNTLGSNVIQITPGGSFAQRAGGFRFPGLGGGGQPGGGMHGNFGAFESATAGQLTFAEATDLSRVEGVAHVDARVSGRVNVNFKGKNASVNIVGVDPTAFNALSTVPVMNGRNLNTNDKYSAILGFSVYNNTFQGEDMLNRQLRIEDAFALKVVGILNASGGSQVVSDNSVYVPISAAKTMLNRSNPSQLLILVKDGYDTTQVAAAVEDRLLQLHRVTPDKEDFTITTAALIQSTLADVIGILSLFLGGIAAISLIVGGIGVANTMFMSILERTKEIGILKAIGLKDEDVLKMFLVEASAIGLIGGLLGIVLSFMLSLLLRSFGVPSLITLDLVLLGLFFSVVVGVASGVIPAWNASKLQPIEALRYE